MLDEMTFRNAWNFVLFLDFEIPIIFVSDSILKVVESKSDGRENQFPNPFMWDAKAQVWCLA